MDQFLLVSTTTPTPALAQQIASALVERRLAACVQIQGPMLSVYRWEGAVEQSEEWLCTAKTRSTLFAEVEQVVTELHEYECPELIASPLKKASEAYLQWLDQELA